MRRRFNVTKTSYRQLIDVETTLCFYWERAEWCQVLEDVLHINPFLSNVTFLYPQKPEDSNVCRKYRNKTIGSSGSTSDLEHVFSCGVICFYFLRVTAAFNVDEINNSKKSKRKSPSRQKATQEYFHKKRIEMERQRERAAIDKTRPCEYLVKHGKCDFVSSTDDLWYVSD